MQDINHTTTGNHSQQRICLVTGATHGIGRQVALELARRGDRVIIHGRNPETAAETLEAIRLETGNTDLSVLLADFADLSQVRAMADRFKAQFSRLDLLVNNAGTFFLTRQKTAYGVEKTLLVNHLAPFLLTHLLLDRLVVAEAARIVNVSSGSHWSGRLDLDDLELRRFYNPLKAYSRSKLANILFTYELARRLAGTPVTANAVHPGLVATNIWHSGILIVDPLLQLWVKRLGLSPEAGADTPLYLACSPEVAGVSGKYFVERSELASSPASYDRELAQRLWEVSARLTGLDPGPAVLSGIAGQQVSAEHQADQH